MYSWIQFNWYEVLIFGYQGQHDPIRRMRTGPLSIFRNDSLAEKNLTCATKRLVTLYGRFACFRFISNWKLVFANILPLFLNVTCECWHWFTYPKTKHITLKVNSIYNLVLHLLVWLVCHIIVQLYATYVEIYFEYSTNLVQFEVSRTSNRIDRFLVRFSLTILTAWRTPRLAMRSSSETWKIGARAKSCIRRCCTWICKICTPASHLSVWRSCNSCRGLELNSIAVCRFHLKPFARLVMF